MHVFFFFVFSVAIKAWLCPVGFEFFIAVCYRIGYVEPQYMVPKIRDLWLIGDTDGSIDKNNFFKV